MGGRLATVQPRGRVQEWRPQHPEAEKPTVTGTRDMILRPFGNGGTVGYSCK